MDVRMQMWRQKAAGVGKKRFRFCAYKPFKTCRLLYENYVEKKSGHIVIVTVTVITFLNLLLMTLSSHSSETKCSNNAWSSMSNAELMNFKAATNFQSSFLASKSYRPNTITKH